MKKQIIAILIIAVVLGSNGCIKLSPGLNMKKTEKRAQKVVDKILHDITPPPKPFDIVQGEADLLKMAEEDIDAASKAEDALISKACLAAAKERVRTVISSIGLSPKDTKSMSESQKTKLDVKFRKDTIKYKELLHNYKNAMNSYEIKVTELTGIIKEKTSLITKLKYVIIGLIVISVLVAAFVPGGMMFVKSFWKGGFKVLKMFGEEAYDSLTGVVQGINHAMDKNPAFDQKIEGSDRTFRQVLEDSIAQKSKDTSFYDGIKSGKNHMVEIASTVASHVKKVT